MKVIVEEVANLDEIEVTIRCREENEEVAEIKKLLAVAKTQLIGKSDDESIIINVSDIYYFEAVENRVFAYGHKKIYEVNYKIQELLELLKHTSFIQTTRTTIMNIDKILKVKTLVNGRIEVVLDNLEKSIITRVYAADFKARLRRKVRK